MTRRNKERHTYRRRSSHNQTGRSFTSAFRTPRSQIAVLAITALVIVLLVLWSNYRRNDKPSAALPAEISVSEAYNKYQNGAYVLDVRTQEEWNEYHAPGTTLIPLDELAARVNEVPQDKTVVVVCRSGNRSQQGRDILLDAGYENVTSMAGGLKTWRDAGYPIATGP